jgi:quercetin dioxygenase-like cupin family protein
MQLIKLEDVKPREVVRGHYARFVHAENMTVAHWRIEAGTTIPEHDHPHEQVVNVLSGKYELTVAGEPLTLEAGMVLVIPGGVRHSGRAITDALLLDVFYPCREDYR